MTAVGIQPKQSVTAAEAVCRSCLQSVQAVEKVHSSEMARLSAYLGSEDLRKSSEVAREALRERSLNAVVLGVPVGKVALYEFTLAHKKMSTELTPDQWEEYGIYLDNSVRSLLAFSKYLESFPTEVIVAFSPQYSAINSCMQYAIQRGIRVLFIESGTSLAHRLGSLRVWDWHVHGLVNPALKYWGNSDRNKVDKASAKAVTSHFRELLVGRHFAVFSPPMMSKAVNVRQKFQIAEAQRVVLLTLSSYDEAYAALLIGGFPVDKVFSSVFRTQAEWLRAVIKWVRQRPEIFLIIRVHPRDFPNKRESVRSEQADALTELLKDPPRNVGVNWPSDNISLYNLLDCVDVVTTGWSVTAVEALILGVPVVTYDQRLPSYPKDIIYTGTDAETYFSNLDEALVAGWSFSNVVNGFRWMAYNFTQCTVTVSKTHGRHERASRGFLERVFNRLKLHYPAVGKPLDLIRWRQARVAATVVNKMLLEGADAIAAVTQGAGRDLSDKEEHYIIRRELAQLRTLMWGSHKQIDGSRGLSRKILEFLGKEHA
jgi:hypothetical protein